MTRYFRPMQKLLFDTPHDELDGHIFESQVQLADFILEHDLTFREWPRNTLNNRLSGYFTGRRLDFHHVKGIQKMLEQAITRKLQEHPELKERILAEFHAIAAMPRSMENLESGSPDLSNARTNAIEVLANYGIKIDTLGAEQRNDILGKVEDYIVALNAQKEMAAALRKKGVDTDKLDAALAQPATPSTIRLAAAVWRYRNH